MDDEKLKALEDKINTAERESIITDRGKPPKAEAQDYTGLKAGFELVASIGAGCLIGWFLDDFFGTLPLFFIVFFLLGTVAGFINVYRTTQGIGQSVGLNHKSTQDAGDE